MKSVLLRELKQNLKLLIIWTLAIGGMGFYCILLYQSMQGEVQEMADMFSNMGAFSDAFGMSTLSIATLPGFFATEVGTIHGLGSGMFAALASIGILSKEEDRHSGEFLLALPISRSKVVTAKALCILVMLVVFTVVCGLFYVGGIAYLDMDFPAGDLMTYLVMQFLMNVEIAGICFLISAFSSRIKMGLGLGMALMLYAFDLIGRVVPDLKDYLFIGPYSYANASEIFSQSETPVLALSLAAVLIIASITGAYVCYNRRDLQS
ncbi:MAG: ABC transporter permease [Lachnospiraceae bacterium]|nr:ABC transporter permease [Lachnospiraceae bacterium]